MVIIPFCASSGIDTSHPSYILATDLVAKTNPVDSVQEALHVASLILRKRRYGTQHHTFDHTYDASQGNVPSLFDHSGFDTIAVGTERVLDKIIKDARTVIEAGPRCARTQWFYPSPGACHSYPP